MGGEITTGVTVEATGCLPDSPVVMFDVTPRQLMKIAGKRLAESYREQLGRYRCAVGVFKINYALDSPAPVRRFLPELIDLI